MRSVRRRSTVFAVGLAMAGLAATSGTTTTGSTRDAPAAEDVCPEDHPDLDASDPVGTLSRPEPQPGRDLCATWVTAEWKGYGPDAELRFVTFGLRTAGDVQLGPERSFAFTWDVPTAYDPTIPVLPDDGYCATTLWVTSGQAQPKVTIRGCGSPLVDYVVGGPVWAQVLTDGDVLEVRIPLRSAPDILTASVAPGATLESYAAVSYLVEPWSEDVVDAGDIAFVPPEDPGADTTA